MATALYIVGLAVMWVFAWGTPTPANILGGVAVAVLLLTVSPDTRPRVRHLTIRPVAIARFAGYVMKEVVRANIQIAREILRRRSRISTGIVAVALPETSDGLLTLVANTLAITPGTMPVEVVQDPDVVYVHVLLLEDVEETRADILHLADLAIRAFGSDRAIAALDEETRP